MSKTKVLIVEDDFSMAKGLKDNFRFQGFEPRVAFDGEAGIEMALEDIPDLVILDIMLPKVNGYEVCAALRREKLEMPILMLSAKGTESDIVRGLDLGADDYMVKPFGLRELFARVKVLVRRHIPERHESYRFGDAILNTTLRTLLIGGEEVSLAKKEFGLLEYFLLNSNRPLTRGAIMQAVWGSSVKVSSRSVDRCVTTLRAKLEKDPALARRVRTLREVGYLFEVPEAVE